MTEKKHYSEEIVKGCFLDFMIRVQSSIIKASMNINNLEANLANIEAMKIKTDASKILHESFKEVVLIIETFPDISFEDYSQEVMKNWLTDLSI